MAGRPTDWSEAVEDDAWAYVDNYEDHGHAFPSIVGLCKVLNRGKSTIYKWAGDDDKQFRDILDAIKENQELVTFNKAMTNDFNATIAKLLLGKHGYHDKQDSTLSGPNGKPMEMTGVQFVGVATKD
jgi:hypothetical protein|tara:strand:+ start:2069 stop:2449 length:381 start_codon:yes stop_codon:yes gene_type:complete